MFTEIQSICAELSAEIAAKGYKTAEVAAYVKASSVIWMYRASPMVWSIDTKTTATLDELRDAIANLPDASDSAKLAVVSDHAAVLARAKELGVTL